MQRAGGSHLQAVVVNRHADRTAADRVIAMAQRVRQRLAHGQGRVERLVDPVEAVSFDSPGDGQGLAQKTLGGLEKYEGVAVELPVVEELGAIDAPEAGDTKQTLWHLEFNALGVAEQHHRRAPQNAFPEKPQTIIEVVNINDPDALKAVVEETGVSEASRADRIASATRRAITEKMDEDPTFYKQFSELLEETIRAYREKRLSEREYLTSVVDLASKIASKDRGRDVPESIRGDEDAQAFFGVLDGQFKTKDDEPVAGDEVAAIAQQIIDIIKSHLIVDIWSNEVARNNLRNAIDDYFFDVLRDEKGIDLPLEMLDDLELKIMDLARARFAA